MYRKKQEGIMKKEREQSVNVVSWMLASGLDSGVSNED